jgi:hypothetical protein
VPGWRAPVLKWDDCSGGAGSILVERGPSSTVGAGADAREIALRGASASSTARCYGRRLGAKVLEEAAFRGARQSLLPRINHHSCGVKRLVVPCGSERGRCNYGRAAFSRAAQPIGRDRRTTSWSGQGRTSAREEPLSRAGRARRRMLATRQLRCRLCSPSFMRPCRSTGC